MPETVSLYYRDDERDKLFDFDAVAKRHQKGSYSRSAAIRESMEMQKMILEVMDKLGYPEDMNPVERRHVVRGALLDLEPQDSA